MHNLKCITKHPCRPTRRSPYVAPKGEQKVDARLPGSQFAALYCVYHVNRCVATRCFLRNKNTGRRVRENGPAQVDPLAIDPKNRKFRDGRFFTSSSDVTQRALSCILHPRRMTSDDHVTVAPSLISSTAKATDSVNFQHHVDPPTYCLRSRSRSFDERERERRDPSHQRDDLETSQLQMYYCRGAQRDTTQRDASSLRVMHNNDEITRTRRRGCPTRIAEQLRGFNFQGELQSNGPISQLGLR